MWRITHAAWPIHTAGSHLEQKVDDWMTGQEATDWVAPGIVLAILLAAMLLLAISRLS